MATVLVAMHNPDKELWHLAEEVVVQFLNDYYDQDWISIEDTIDDGVVDWQWCIEIQNGIRLERHIYGKPKR